MRPLTEIVPEQENPAPPPTDTYKRDAFNIVISRAKIELYVAACLPRIISLTQISMATEHLYSWNFPIFFV